MFHCPEGLVKGHSTEKIAREKSQESCKFQTHAFLIERELCRCATNQDFMDSLGASCASGSGFDPSNIQAIVSLLESNLIKISLSLLSKVFVEFLFLSQTTNATVVKAVWSRFKQGRVSSGYSGFPLILPG